MTVHIERLSSKLSEEGIELIMYNFGHTQKGEAKVINVGNPLFWYLKLLFGVSPKIHYVITTRTLIRFLAVLFGRIRNKHILLRVGGKSLENAIANKHSTSHWMSAWAVRNCTQFIGVSQEICDVAASLGKDQSSINLIPGFIKPFNDGKRPPEEIVNFFGQDSLKIIVSGQIYAKEDFDIYGVWDVLKMLSRLKEAIPNIKVVLFNYTINRDDQLAYEEYLGEIREKGLEDHLYIYRSKTQLWPSINYSDIFLRPSYTDGDANSLREALSLKVYSIASDAVKRPAGTVLYPVGNVDELVNCILSFNNQHFNKPKPHINVDIDDNYPTTLELITNLL
ncbi:MAG: hypothetical protein AAF696_29560 [Bacteroidota bacterium]